MGQGASLGSGDAPEAYWQGRPCSQYVTWHHLHGYLLLYSRKVVFDSLTTDCSTAGFPALHCLPEFVQTHVHLIGDAINHLILCHPSYSLPSIFPIIRVFSNQLTLRIKKPKYWSFSISSSSEHPGLISFRMDWLDLLALQGTLKSLLQHHSSKASILW